VNLVIPGKGKEKKQHLSDSTNYHISAVMMLIH